MKKIYFSIIFTFSVISSLVAQTEITIDLSETTPNVKFKINGRDQSDPKKLVFSTNNKLIVIPHTAKKHLASLRGASGLVSISSQETYASTQTEIPERIRSGNKLLIATSGNTDFSFTKDGTVQGQNFKIPYPLKITISELTTNAANLLVISNPPVYPEKEFGDLNLQDDDDSRGVNNLSKARQLLMGNAIYKEHLLEPYDDDNNRVYLFFFRNQLISRMPVNVDEDDEFVPIVVAPEDEINYYEINIVEGEYSPSDLALRPFTPLVDLASGAAAQSTETVRRPELEIRPLPVQGPFTTERFRFTITRYNPSSKETESSEIYSVRINNLYHVGVGVSLVNSQLGNPAYDLAPLPDGSGNTIITLNNTPRTFLTFNVIWYWSVFQNPSGSTITRGRDVLKDEAAFTIRRIFPTVGVSVDGQFRENFFGGFVYEFARGGSIVAGGHYGKIQVLAEPNFVQGESVFTGTKNDIKLTDRYLLKFFLGVNVDTRIINTLFGRGRASN